MRLTAFMLNLRSGVNKMFYPGPLGHFFHFPSDRSDHMETAQRPRTQRSLNVFSVAIAAIAMIAAIVVITENQTLVRTWTLHGRVLAPKRLY